MMSLVATHLARRPLEQNEGREDGGRQQGKQRTRRGSPPGSLRGRDDVEVNQPKILTEPHTVSG